MDLILSCGAESASPCQEIAHIVWNLKSHYSSTCALLLSLSSRTYLPADFFKAYCYCSQSTLQSLRGPIT